MSLEKGGMLSPKSPEGERKATLVYEHSTAGPQSREYSASDLFSLADKIVGDIASTEMTPGMNLIKEAKVRLDDGQEMTVLQLLAMGKAEKAAKENGSE